VLCFPAAGLRPNGPPREGDLQRQKVPAGPGLIYDFRIVPDVVSDVVSDIVPN